MNLSHRPTRSLVTPISIALCVVLGVIVGSATTLINPLYLLAVVPILFVAWWSVQSARRGIELMILIIALAPRIASPVSIGFKPTLLDAAMIATFAAWLLWRNANTPPTRTPLAAPILSMVFVALLTFIFGTQNGALTTLVARRFGELISSLLIVFVLISILREANMLQHAVRLWIIAGALSSLVGIVFYIINAGTAERVLSALRPFGYPSGKGVIRYVLDDPSNLKRAIGLWIDPNAFGGYLMLTASLALPQLFTKRPVMPRLWAWLCAAIICGTLALTISRSAMLGLATAALIIGSLRYRRLLLLGAISFAAILVLPQTRALIEHFLNGFAGRDLATQMRFGEYKDAFRLIERYPLLGVGFIDTPDVDLYIGVSSMYLLIAQQMGLLGILAFAIILVGLFVNAMRTWREVRQDEMRMAIWLGAHCGIVGALLSGIFDHYFFNIDFHNSVMTLWFVIALALASAPAWKTRKTEEGATNS